ncbi:hypothetical protein P154DRAFT_614482 [Amniculicola lignicola CBS 123094]|uniref:CFEM domain-containing protein n=1 Tax=Amniculicola lignicola CBS 123094 TaxID=1392246 RepID=A0A6A5X581_9PLEO|nr:hypothetical protein P154DRAFT_614482 [Amniculicola lignicola CBS 123094]
MRGFRALAFIPITLIGCARAQNSTELLAEAVEILPTCALNCMLIAISESTCSLSDFYCIGKNKELNDAMTACVRKACTIRESLAAKNFSSVAFGAPVRNHTKLVSYTGVIGGASALLAVITRVCARLPWFGGTWGLDDWGILATMIPVVPLTILSVPLANHGLGRDMWTVPYDSITTILHIYYFDELFYLSAIALTKISILLFYLRIFPNPNFRRLVFATIALCVCYILAFVPATAAQCLPIRQSWERWDGEHHGKCFNLNTEGWLTAALNIVLDITVICLPLREMSHLLMSRKKKAGIMLMFLGGGFVTVVSALRLKWMIQFANTENVTWDYTPVGYWSTLEVHIGIIVACLPALRSLQHRIFPSTKLPPSYYNNSAYTDGHSKRRSVLPSWRQRGKSAGSSVWASRSGTGISQASMVRSRDRCKDKDFVHLEEYEVQDRSISLADFLSSDSEKQSIGRGVNRTQIERGSRQVAYVEEGEHEISALPVMGSGREQSLARGEGWGKGIAVRKEYSVDVEKRPNELAPAPVREGGGRGQGRAEYRE